MATLVLSSVGGAIGTALAGPFGGLVGRALGGLAGYAVDRTILMPGGGTQTVAGHRLTNVQITTSTEGAAVNRVIGRARIGGQMIWATRFEEEVVVEEQEVGGGKGLGGGGTTVRTETYLYYANFAVAFCEGPVARIGRIWADGKEVDQELVTIRRHLGTEDQAPDSLIVAKEGAGEVPSYRGIAYLVFERLPLEDYGNRIPMVTAEIFRPVGRLESRIRGVSIIPGATEFGYSTSIITKVFAQGESRIENRHTKLPGSSFEASLDMLEALAPNVETVTLVVAWFGTDLRCGACEIVPKVETWLKVTRSEGSILYPWLVGGQLRLFTPVVSSHDGTPAYGGSPSDITVVQAIKELKARGYRVLVYPFVMMDVPAGNTRPDPYSDEAAAVGQPAYPWRGRITCSPAPGFAGSPDRTADAASQVAAFMGSATAGQFTWLGVTVLYGGGEKSYSRFILHMATLAKAGGADAFAIGSEMVGMTTVRSGASTYPFVEALRGLAAEARTILGPGVKIGYAADWSEYHSHRPGDGSGDVFFHLDPLWADDNIDFVGIDNYLPLADWRDGTEHLDFDPDGPTTIYDRDYLRANVEGGEYYDWFYASPADREAQARTSIADTAHGEHWVFRNKDIRNWWANAHHDRPGGARQAGATAWVPQSKPVWFTEVGCPAADKGANQPNVFWDPKSSESFLPHFSSGARDDAMQRAYLEAMIGYWEEAENNPLSTVYGGPMIDPGNIAVWTWDARVPPSFPLDDAQWADGPNWTLGHWISGRLGAAPAAEAVEEIARMYGVEGDVALEPMAGVVDGVVLDQVMSARAALEALEPAYLFAAVESEGKIRVRSREGAAPRVVLEAGDLVEEGEAEPWRKVRAQETELPAVVKIAYGEFASDDQPGGVEARRTTGGSRAVREVSLPCMLGEDRARAIAETLLREAWVGREGLTMTLPPSLIALDPGDVIRFAEAGNETWRIAGITDGLGRRAELVRTQAGLSGGIAAPARSGARTDQSVLGPPALVFLDGPLLRDGDDDWRGYVGAYASPWAGGVALYRSPEAEGFALDSVLGAPVRLGELAADFHSGPAWRWDRVNALQVTLTSGILTSASEIQVLNGANAIAVENADGEWEVVQFRDAELIAPRTYRLTSLLRGQRGTEHAMRDPVAAAARVVVLDGSLSQPRIPPALVGLPLNWRAGPARRPVTDTSYLPLEHTITGKARRPLAPVHLKARRGPGGDITLSWVRRTRRGGDSWDNAEVPLGEEAEAYEVGVLDGGAVVRTLHAAAPAAVYTAAQQAADFGAPVDTLDWRVVQTNAAGPGIAASTTSVP
ncbi:baseplate multidomain protein megatron [Lutibaculum baratangense]|uniref:Host specificity protein n=1 Tax=Lutibaculum baratangense AMV1 TaxID=631454 RepID=V4RBL9_9HYPH|nr:glycoside hydrolase/phage tail family protein [Lutibaculum baratangense]ESR22804.1 host specificity protein [Lutibaculum baratangense AMV1]